MDLKKANELMRSMQVEDAIQMYLSLFRRAKAESNGVNPLLGIYEFNALRAANKIGIPNIKSIEDLLHLSDVNWSQIDYGQWQRTLFDYDSTDSINLETMANNGIHRFRSGFESIDFLLDGIDRLRSFDKPRVILAVFTAAIPFSTRKTNLGPFFSGLKLAKSLNLPLLAIADPSVSRDPSLQLGWYSGNNNCPKLPEAISKILDKFANFHHCRLILFGVSGGGFGTLNVMRNLHCKAGALIVNPQTSISDYRGQVVSAYIKSAFPNAFNDLATGKPNDPVEPEHLKQCLNHLRISHDLNDTIIKSPNTILYLQNSTDNEQIVHANKFMGDSFLRIGPRSFHSKARGIAMYFGDFGDGHVAPSGHVLKLAIEAIARNVSVKNIAVNFDRQSIGIR